MIKAFIRHLRKAIAWRAAVGRLEPMSKLEEFEAYVEEVKPSLFLQHRSWSAYKRLDFEAVLEKLQLEPKGLKFLDMGPGSAATRWISAMSVVQRRWILWSMTFFSTPIIGLRDFPRDISLTFLNTWIVWRRASTM